MTFRDSVRRRTFLVIVALLLAAVPACEKFVTKVMVTVRVSGSGSGQIVSSKGLSCTVTAGVVSPNPCMESFGDAGGVGTLLVTATPAPSNVLSELSASGDASCSGQTCALSFDSQDQDVNFTVSVTFDPVSPDQVKTSPESATIPVGGSTGLSAQALASGTPVSGQAFSWSSSDNSIATVSPTSSGGATTVTGVAPGTVMITARIGAVSGVSTITVVAVPPADVEVTPPDATIAVGSMIDIAAQALDASGSPLTDQSFTWTSSDDAIATVDPTTSDGTTTVTGVAEGTVTITAATGTVSGAATITVEPPAPVQVEVSPPSATITVGALTQLTAEARDAAGNPLGGQVFDWISSDPAVATVAPASSDGMTTVTGVAQGVVTVTATTGMASGSSTITVDPLPNRDPIIFEDDFSVGDLWELTVLAVTGGGMETAENRADGGVTGVGDGYRYMTHVFPAPGSIAVQHRYTGGSYKPQEDGAIDYVDYSEWRIVLDPLASGTAIGALINVVQGGVRYTATIDEDNAFRNVAWGKQEVLKLKAQDFSPAGLDFTDAGEEIFFGFFRSNTTGNVNGRTTTHGIDNWRVEVVRVQP